MNATRLHVAEPAPRVRLAVAPTAPDVPLSELVLVDQHEAQGWRVRHDERLDRLFEERCDWVRSYGRADQLAVDDGELTLTYDQLDARSNRLARYLRLHGASGGDRIALLFDRPADSYVAVLAVLKIGAAYVPLDPDAAAAHLAAIVADAGVRTVLSTSDVVDRIRSVEQLTARAELVHLDRAAPLIAEQDGRRLLDVERGTREGGLAYITYPAGSEGRPGVAVDHRSIGNFVKVAAEVYGIRPSDRVYQGVAVAFDFSVEEIWVSWAVGATLVPRPAGTAALRGPQLHAFLSARRVSALCCVPGLLATLDDDLPDLRFLLVSGAACPAELVTRWHRPGRRFLNVYGPAEATVSATWTELHPDRPVTIGVPLPTYSTVILDVDDPSRALPHGRLGEIGIAGIGLSCGYLDRADLTERAFVPDFLGIPANPSGRIYRTGDLGRVTPDGEIEHHGRIDLAEPGRCYRTEFEAIEAALHAAEPDPEPVVEVAPSEPAAPALPPLSALLSPPAPVAPAPAPALPPLSALLSPPAPAPAPAAPAPALPPLSALLSPSAPVAPAPAPVLPPLSALLPGSAPAPAAIPPAPEPAPAPAGVPAEVLAGVLAEVLGVASVAVDAHVFDELGADSLTMARFCARLRKRDDLPTVSIKDVYAHPTAAGLAAAFAPAGAPTRVRRTEPDEPPMVTTSLARAAGAVRGVRHRHVPSGKPRYLLCGALQLLAFVAYSSIGSVAAFRGFAWVSAAPDLLGTYVRAVVLIAGSFLGLCALPVLAKWVLVGRWTPRQIPVWSLAYLRFWTVKTLVQRSPMTMFVGTPLYVLYLRALGARIGRGVTILSRNVPVCTDLLTVGDGTVIRKDSYFTGYRAHAGLIQTATVGLGRDVLVGEKTVLDIGTSLGDGAQLGHTSALHAGQAVPAGARWHGSPAVPTEVDYRVLPYGTAGTSGRPHGAVSTLRRTVYGAVSLLNLLVLVVPAVVVAATVLFARFPVLGAVLGSSAPAFTSWTFYRQAVVAATVLFLGGIVVGLAVTLVVPRVLNLALTPGTDHRLYGVRYWAHRTVGRLTNRRFFTELLGDSSFIVGYLRALGYRLSPVVQTGSNFGMAVQHDNPYLSGVGGGTVVADGLSLVNADYSSTAFRLSPVSIGRHNFLGNNIAYPAAGRTGDDCLLATKVMVPIDGPVRTGVGLLGSPSFEIPRSVERDNGLDVTGPELRRRLAAKNRHNAVTIALRLLVRWAHLVGVTMLASGADRLSGSYGVAALVPFSLAGVLFTVTFYVLVERAVDRLQILAPRGCSIYDKAFWGHERAWKVTSEAYFRLFDGTPFKTVLWRLLGVRVGRRVFDDGCFLTERSFVAIGDGATLNAGTVVQCHSQEDGAFKSDRTVLGAGVTLGVAAFVHYGVAVGDAAVLAADSFLMKGEEVPPHALWGGNPAKTMPEHAADLRVRRISRHDGAMSVGTA